MPETYHAGELAYIDSFLGLIPCKVLRVDEPSTPSVTSGKVVIRVTADRPAFRRGEVSTETGHNVIPRSRVYTRNGMYRIRSGYLWA